MPQVCGKVRKKFDQQLAERNGQNVRNGMDELLSLPGGVEDGDFMSVDILLYLFVSIVKQDRPVGNPYWDSWCTTASKWKTGLDKFKEEAMADIEKHEDCRVFYNGRVFPGLPLGVRVPGLHLSQESSQLPTANSLATSIGVGIDQNQSPVAGFCLPVN